MTIQDLLKEKKATPEEGLEVFDQLPPVTLDFMLGQWKGYELNTGHPMEGLLDASGWYGKLFVNTEQVHPLLMYSLNKKRVFPINPSYIPLGIPLPKSKIAKVIIALFKPILKTKKAKARMRMIKYRGKVTGTMAYDSKGIFDHFAKIDENSMLGVMDLKGASQPYFFVLTRDTQPKLEI
ncbi:DUF4334 domain-containing protein [Ekhidna sp.]